MSHDCLAPAGCDAITGEDPILSIASLGYRRQQLVAAVLLAACTHSDGFTYSAPDVGPSGSGSDVLLTYNVANDWPVLTEDGTGIVYAFQDESEASIPVNSEFESPGIHIHRCMGEIPVDGGTRHWEFCDNRAALGTDTLSSFPAFAMGSDGRLLYAESITPRKFPFADPTVTLWLADSASPYRRQALVRFPVIIADSTIDWLADLAWTGPTTFLGVGQRYAVYPHCRNCSPVDSIFYGEVLLQGTITGGTAQLAAIPGTTGATGYSVAENGASIVFSQLDNLNLMKVPIGGGAPVVVAAVAPAGSQVLGVSCRGTTCVVAVGPFAPYSLAGPGAYQLESVALGTGVVTTIKSFDRQIVSQPLLMSTGNVIAQVGPDFGHIQTYGGGSLALHLYKGLVPAIGN